MSREAMQLALEALESDPLSHAGLVSRKQAIAALRQALETKQEPVLWLKTWSDGSVSVLKTKSHAFADHELEPIYTAPPKKEWVGLMDEEFMAIAQKYSLATRVGLEYFKDELEAKLKEKNQ
jgi:hypothetical protein